MLLISFSKIFKTRINCWQLKITFLLAICILAVIDKRALGQLGITPDNSLGDEQSQVTVDQNTPNLEHIEGGAKRGENLFHSFSEFNVPSDKIVDFANPGEVNNIFSRVTGSDPSDILGQLKVSGDADLFLLNPNGIIFGSNASLDIGGSFIATTADSFNFADGTSFSATTSGDKPLLTVNIPVGLQFGNSAESIEVRNSNLQVLSEKTLALVGGEILLTGELNDSNNFNLVSPGGRIEIGSVDINSKVILNQHSEGWKTDYSQVNAFKNIELKNGAEIEASGEGGGSIQFYGSEIRLSQNSGVYADTEGSKNGEEIFIKGDKAIFLEDSSIIKAEVLEEASGNGGNIKIATEELTIKDDHSYISTSSYAEGDGGNISVTASKFLNLDGIESSEKNIVNGLFSVAQDLGNAGNIKINTNELNILNGGQISVGNTTKSQGNSGNLTINAVDSIKLIGRSPNGELPSGFFTRADGSGNAGDLTIVTKQLDILDGAGISTSAIGPGRGGDIFIQATESTNIVGININNFPSRLSARAGTDNNAGNINVETNAFRVADGAIVETRTTDTGNGGNIFVNANTFEAVNGGQILAGTLENSTGNGGNIKISVTDQLIISGKTDTIRRIRLGEVENEDIFVNEQSGESGLFVRSQGTGQPGNIEVQAGTLEIDNQGIISAETLSGQGGNISLQLQNFLKLSQEGKITTSALADGDGGNITINSPFVVTSPSENSDITANANEGKGGFIEIFSDAILGLESRTQLTPLSDITAFSQRNPDLNGTVKLEISEDQVLQELTELPTDIVDRSQLITKGCSVNNDSSQFIVTGT
ncbi:MAG: filamentous hemagglutinin N-terminal domain-containing protein, partial [Waterburya sp.]